jgi:hypothetical protein
MDFLAWFVEKKIEASYLCGIRVHTSATSGKLYVCSLTRIYLRYIIFASRVTFSFDSLI